MKVKFHLMRENLWDLVRGREDEEDGETSVSRRVARAYAGARDERAFGIIALGLGDDYIHHISDLETASEAWVKLDTLFGARSQNSKLALKISFFELQMKLGDSIASHVNQMRSLMTQLASVKSPVTEDDAMAVLLKSMPEEYDNLVTTLKNLPNPTLEGMISALQEEERKRNQRATSSEGAFSAKYKQRKPCKHCGKTNHLEKDCFRIKPCGICGKHGHRDSDCYSKKKADASNVAEVSEIANLVADDWAF